MLLLFTIFKSSYLIGQLLCLEKMTHFKKKVVFYKKIASLKLLLALYLKGLIIKTIKTFYN